MSKGPSFDELWPGKYLKSGEFKGKAVTLTLKSIEREMLPNGSGDEEGAVVASFEETQKLWVVNKTCGVALRAMFGDDSGEWIGKRITLHPVPDASGLSESGTCIRVLGSPDLAKELKFRAHVGRSMLTQTMKVTKAKPAPAVDADTGEVEDENAATDEDFAKLDSALDNPVNAKAADRVLTEELI